MAAIWKRRNYWRLEIRRLGQPRQNRTFNTKAEAEAWARQVEAKMDRGEFVDLKEAERNTLGDLLLRYSEQISPQKKGWIASSRTAGLPTIILAGRPG
jgi:hypothetical protein